MSEQIRVLDKDTGHVRTVHEAEVAHGNYDVLDEDAVDPLTGVTLPPEFNRPAASSAGCRPKSTATIPSGQPAETKEIHNA